MSKSSSLSSALQSSSKSSSFELPEIRIQPKILAAVVVFLLIMICGILSYPPLEIVSGFEEGTTQEELDSCLWAKEQVPQYLTLASDHRMSSMIFGFSGINSSWEYAPKTLQGESFSEMQEEISNANLPSGNKKLDLVLITDAIKNGVALKQWENAQPMTDEAINKFETSHFIKLYDNGDAQIYLIEEIV